MRDTITIRERLAILKALREHVDYLTGLYEREIGLGKIDIESQEFRQPYVNQSVEAVVKAIDGVV